MNDDRKVEILEALMDDELWGLVSIDTDRDETTILYERGARSVGGEPAIEIPHGDPYLVDESERRTRTGEIENVPGVSPPPKTLEELLSEYGCLAKGRGANTYVVVDEKVASKRPPTEDQR